MSVFSWKTKAESKATTSSGSYEAKVFSRINSVRTSSLVELIYANFSTCGTARAKTANLACHATFQEYSRVLVNMAQFLEHRYTLFVIRQELEVFLRNLGFEFSDT